MTCYHIDWPCFVCNEPVKEKDQVYNLSTEIIRCDEHFNKIVGINTGHWDCFFRWEHREDYSQKYFDAEVEDEKVNPFWGKIYLNDQVFVKYNPYDNGTEIRITLKYTATELMIGSDKWNDWIFNEGYKDACFKKEEKAKNNGILVKERMV